MDYETPDGSQFSLQEVFTDGDGDGNNSPAFQYTSITALVNGEAFAGKSDQRMEDVDEIDILDLLRPVPLENINPLVPDDFTRAPPLSHDAHFLKAPSFMYEDIEPGRTFVAACLLNEATVLEKLRNHPHPNIVQYYGCVVQANRITQLCLMRYESSLADHVTRPLSQQQRQQIQNNPILSYAGQQTGVLPPPDGVSAAAKKKPAPPPPPKKSTLQPNDGAGPAPPPIPMSSKPKFG